MKTRIKNSELLEALESLRLEVAELRDRTAALERRLSAPMQAAPAKSAEKPHAEGLSEETILVISAAVAAYLGVKAHIRQIRLLDASPWAQQGRVTIQASHLLAMGHG
jgi:methylmalonyl-CoA carboxyltransferase large subunit